MNILINILIFIVSISIGFALGIFVKDAEYFKSKYFEALNYNKHLLEENKQLKDNNGNEFLYN